MALESDDCELSHIARCCLSKIRLGPTTTTSKPDLKAQLICYLNQWLTYEYLEALELDRRLLRLTSHLILIMQGQGILVTDVLDAGLEE